MPGAGRPHGPPAAKNAGGRYHRFSRDIPAFPARWVYDLYALSPVRRAFWPPYRDNALARVARVIPASGYQDHATSSSAKTLPVLQPSRSHRIPHPTYRDDAYAPLTEAGRG